MLLTGPAPDPALAHHAAHSDQTDGWTMVTLDGTGKADVPARGGRPRTCAAGMRQAPMLGTSGAGHEAGCAGAEADGVPVDGGYPCTRSAQGGDDPAGYVLTPIQNALGPEPARPTIAQGGPPEVTWEQQF